MNIFNKYIIKPEIIYDKISNNIDFTAYEVEQLDQLKSVIKIKDEENLKWIIKFYSEHYPNLSLNWLDVSDIIHMNSMFYNTKYTGDISEWDVSNVTSMFSMFMQSSFNNDISRWDVSKV